MFATGTPNRSGEAAFIPNSGVVSSTAPATAFDAFSAPNLSTESIIPLSYDGCVHLASPTSISASTTASTVEVTPDQHGSLLRLVLTIPRQMFTIGSEAVYNSQMNAVVASLNSQLLAMCYALSLAQQENAELKAALNSRPHISTSAEAPSEEIPVEPVLEPAMGPDQGTAQEPAQEPEPAQELAQDPQIKQITAHEDEPKRQSVRYLARQLGEIEYRPVIPPYAKRAPAKRASVKRRRKGEKRASKDPDAPKRRKTNVAAFKAADVVEEDKNDCEDEPGFKTAIVVKKLG